MSYLEKAKTKLLEAAQEYEDACHENETDMDACVESAKSNRLAYELRLKAQMLKNYIGFVLQ